WDRVSGPDHPVPVSRTIVQRVLKEAIAVMHNDLLESGDFRDARSLVSFQLRSVLAVPMVASERVLGVIYLGSRNPAIRFDESHLQLLTAIAGVAAMALENARHLERLESEKRLLQDQIDIQHDMVGEGPRMQEVYQFISRVSATDSTVLIQGE